MLSQDLISRFAAIVGDANALRSEEAIAPYLEEPRGKFHGTSGLVLSPANTGEVSQILQLANETGTAIVPQGGNTGLVGGQIAFNGEVIVSLSRMNRVREINGADAAITLEAGTSLQSAQDAAEQHDLIFPLWIASQGTAQIGGNLSTNAGGINVIAYGNTRDLCLGLEVVLPSGEVWNGLSALRKDNTGYDLKHLFIGAEGTLGIITAASMKLAPRPHDKATAFAAVASPEAAVELLNTCKQMSGGAITAFEIMPRSGIDMTIKHAGCRDPLNDAHQWYVLFELAGFGTPGQMQDIATSVLEQGLERAMVLDATLATSQQQAGELWRLREAMSEVQRIEGGSIKHDICVPVSRVAEFLHAATAKVAEMLPGCRPVPFGHIGDGNIHFNVSQPVGGDKQAFLAEWEHVNRAVHTIVREMGGSISAEHGIGTLKRDELAETKSPVALAMMRSIKTLLDPNNIMNPGKVL